jgi:hypothetical protein
MKTQTRRVLAILASCLLLGAIQSAWAAAGKTLFVAGMVNVERGGSRPLKVGDEIEVGDVIVTGEASRAQLLMGDGARIALRAVTRFRVDAFKLPSNIQQVGRGSSVAASGETVSTLLKGGFRTRTGVIGKSDSSAYEIRTPIGTLGVRGTDYTAVFCRGDCADAPGLPPGQPIPDGLYLAVDEGTITFNGRGLSLTLTAPRFEFIPLQTGEPQQLIQPPAFLRQDGGGPLALAGRAAPGTAAATSTEIGDFNDRRSPSDTDPTPERPAAPADQPVIEEVNEDEPADRRQLRVQAVSPGGLPVELTNPIVPVLQQSDLAISVPGNQNGIGYVAANTLGSDELVSDVDGLLTGFAAPVATAGVPVSSTFDIGSASSANEGDDATTGITWGRWTDGTATVSRGTVATDIDLANASLHWILSPGFEVAPVLPTTGTAGFVLAGSTDPTDMLGNIGTLGGAFLQADFTNATVTSTLALNINGYDWIANGTGAMGGNLFDGTYDDVLVDGRVTGSGDFNGFFTADALGAGLSYVLNESVGSLGTISGVAALIPGTVVLPTPTIVRRHVAFGYGFLGQTFGEDDDAVNTRAQATVDTDGDLTQFQVATGTWQIGTAATVDRGLNADTNLHWGRWTGGSATGPAGALSLANSSLHWIIGGEYGAAPVLPQTGTADYVLIGGTNPTDTRGNIGTLGAASFSANFTNATVASAWSLTIDGRTWYASGTGSYTQGTTGFSGTYAGNVGSIVPGTGSFSGFFTAPTLGGATASGAGLSYRFHDIFAFDELSGVLAFQQGTGNPLPPPPLAVRDISFSSLAGDARGNLVAATPAQYYATDVDFNLTRFQGTIDTDPSDDATVDIGTSTTAEFGLDPVTMMRWGRWAGGDITVTGINNGQSAVESLAQSSIHWIQGANGATPPVLPTTGTAVYTLLGFTQPTDNIGNVGSLGSATFEADFTSLTVATTLDVTVDNLNWIMTGAGTIGGQATPAHHFNGGYTGNIIQIQAVASGTFSGFFTAPGGAGLTYSLSDGQGVNQVNGAVVFRGP